MYSKEFKKGDKVKLNEFWIGNQCFASGGIGIIQDFKNGDVLIQKDDGVKLYWSINHIELAH